MKSAKVNCSSRKNGLFLVHWRARGALSLGAHEYACRRTAPRPGNKLSDRVRTACSNCCIMFTLLVYVADWMRFIAQWVHQFQKKRERTSFVHLVFAQYKYGSEGFIDACASHALARCLSRLVCENVTDSEVERAFVQTLTDFLWKYITLNPLLVIYWQLRCGH